MPDHIKVVALGAGHLANHIIPALHTIGCRIVQVYSRSQVNANALAHKVNAQGISDIKELKTEAELYLIMLKDDVIEQFCATLPRLDSDQIIAHTSGATNIEVLKAKGMNYGSFYPLDTFRKNQDKNLEHTPFLIHGNNAHTIRQLRILARKISTSVTECGDEDRLRYHLSAVFINNFNNHLACLAQDFLMDYDLNPKLLNPIALNTFENIINTKACSSQTGPAARQDFKLMNTHLNLLKAHPPMKSLYKELSDSIIDKINKDKNEDCK